MAGHNTVIHLASNPDIALRCHRAGHRLPRGHRAHQCVVEAMRQTGTRQILYASGSGVYGEVGEVEAREDHGPLVPISTYGASKLAGEALIASYCSMFDMRGCIFRFGNVVGRRQTHGIGFDFALPACARTHKTSHPGRRQAEQIVCPCLRRRFRRVPRERIGRSPISKHSMLPRVTISRLLRSPDLACACLGLRPDRVRFEYTGGDRGWKGDVPVIRLNIDKIRNLGCARPGRLPRRCIEAMQAMCADLQEGATRTGRPSRPRFQACRGPPAAQLASFARSPDLLHHGPTPPRGSVKGSSNLIIARSPLRISLEGVARTCRPTIGNSADS